MNSDLLRQRAPDLRELQRDEDEQRDLRGERLRRRDADLEPAARVEHRVDLARDLRAHLVRDRDGARAVLAREPHRGDRVARLARLRDPDHERVLREHRVAVDPLARDVRLDRDARPLLDDVAADDAGVVRGAAREDDDAAQVADLLVGEPEAFEHELRAVPDAVADRLAHRFGLLVDLLEHEGLVAALLGFLVVPVDGSISLCSTGPSFVKKRAPSGVIATTSPSSISWIRACLGRNAVVGGGEEHLAVADADDERALVARADEQVGMVVVDDDEREVAFELGVRGAHRLERGRPS